MWDVLVVIVDVRKVSYEAMTPQCGRSLVQVLVVLVDIGVVINEAMSTQCGGQWFRPFIKVDIGVVTCEAIFKDLH